MPPSNEAAISQVQQHPSQALAKAGYELLNAEALSDFVAQHSELIDILVQAYTPLTAFFDGAKLQLEYRQDPEIPDWEMVWIAVVVEIPDSQAEAEAMFEHATQRLDAFDQFCWLEVPSEIRQLLGVDLKFHALPMAGLLDAGRAATTRAAQTLQR
ncbi:MAG: hypothetical protein ACFBSG_00465 [Leptolyngbyaceae cyanobacterium]